MLIIRERERERVILLRLTVITFMWPMVTFVFIKIPLNNLHTLFEKSDLRQLFLFCRIKVCLHS
jgi:hypothetical protein